MEVISIGIEDENSPIKSMLDLCMKASMERNKDYVLLGCEELGTHIFYRYNINKEEMVGIIGDAIWHYMIDCLLKQIIEREYAYFDQSDHDEIWVAAVNKIKFEDMVASSSMHDTITAKVRDYMDYSDEILIDGFIKFRFKDEIVRLIDAVDSAVEDIMMEREYNEFVKLLRYFVEVQEPKIDEIHVVVEPDNSYKLMDADMHLIDNHDMMEEMAREVTDRNISGDDILISSLITMAPSKIVLHNVEYMNNLELLNTINNVFYGKVNIMLSKNL
ncbi:MAG: hypothetical protein PWQ93_689 [Clostridiales bacterium]|nr:hypothetical protein [Clostridiales bacterium]